MNILIADDESVIREGVSRTILAQFPTFKVHAAANASEAADIMDRESIDIVLTDILMPGLNGLEFMKVSRRNYPSVKWVVISAHSEFAYAQQAVQLGARDYLLKPIGKQRVTELIGTLQAEIAREREANHQGALLRGGLKFLREAVFQRLAAGLDLGKLDLQPFSERHPTYYLVMVTLDSGTKNANLEHFIVENVLGELIEMRGDGFVVAIDRQCLLGLVTFEQDGDIDWLLGELKSHLKHYLKIPFQVLNSEKLTEFRDVPDVVARFREASALGKFETIESGGDKAIDIALQYIQAHYAEELSLERVAAVVFLNPAYFSLLFKQKTGQGYKDYVTSLRLEQAKTLLTGSDLRIADIAERIGYNDVRHFTQMFRKKYDMTPTEYRHAH